MKIVFHSDAFTGRQHYGLGRYSRELWHALRHQAADLELIPFALRGQQTTGEGADYPVVVRPAIDGRAVIAAWATFGAPLIEYWISAPDLVHSVELDYPVSTRRPWVVTVHDLGPLTHPEFFTKSRPWLRRRALQQAVDHAAAIVSVSKVTAEALQDLAGSPVYDRLHIIPEGVSEPFFAAQDTACLSGVSGLPSHGEPYFLWTGSLNPRKNLRNVLRAFEAVADQIPQHLVLAGGLGWDHGDVLAGINDSRFSARIHRPNYVTDEQLRALYQHADGFIYVSLMEGFGLPILEAMASGCPVITSNLSSMPEVAGDAALLVDPYAPDMIADAMKHLALNKVLQSDLTARGKKRAEMFTWRNCAERMLDVYHSVI